MNFLKNTLAIAILFAISSADARTVTTQPTAPAKKVTTPTRRPQVRPTKRVQPAAQAKSYKQLRDEVLKMNANKVIDKTTNMLSSAFMDELGEKVMASQLSNTTYNNLLQTARDKFAQFSGDYDKDLALLREINQQIKNSVDFFNMQV